MEMKKFFSICLLLLPACLFAGETIEMLPFGDFEHWAVRYITESKIIGGRVKTLYAPAPTDTFRLNGPFEYGKNGNIWSVSNAYARVAGVEKASGTTYPERRGSGWCARLDAKLDSVVAARIINLKVYVAGTLFTGKTLEPVGMAGAGNPYTVISMGVPFDRHPVALMLDYKALIEQSDTITYAKAVSKPKYKQGRDCAEIYIYLQHRWEDKDGNIYSRRVGTGYERILKSVPEWKNDHRVPIRWGDITMQPDYKDYEGLGMHNFYTQNSKGKMVPIQEIAYGSEAPTHMIIMLTSGSYEAFVGHEGNTLWVDNVRLVY